MKTRLRRSLQVSLALIGAITFGCSREETRYTYKSLEDCLADWGNTEECEDGGTDDQPYPGTTTQGNGNGVRRPGHFWIGPRVFPGRSTWSNKPRSTSSTGTPTRSSGTTKIRTGGFGGSGHHMSTGG